MRNGAREKRKDLHLSTGTLKTGTSSDGWSTRTEDYCRHSGLNQHTCTLSFIHQGGDPDAHARLFYVSLVHNASGAPPTLYNSPRPPAAPFVTPPSHSISLNPSKSPLSENFMEHFCTKKEVECGQIKHSPCQQDYKYKSVWINYLAYSSATILKT